MRSVKFSRLTRAELGYVVGLFLGDGYSYYGLRDRHYTVQFFLNSVSDGDILKTLLKLLKRLQLNVFVSKDARFNMNIVKVYSKTLYSFVHGIRRSFRANDASPEYNLGILSGFIDAEGYVKHGEIQVAQKDELLLREIVKLCEWRGICCKLWRAKNYPAGFIWRARIAGCIPKFSEIKK